MANEEQLKILKQGVNSWNLWRKDNPETIPDLRYVNLRGAKLSEVNLSGANLFGANLRGADLVGANLFRAILIRSELGGANLSAANLHMADLVEALFFHAKLIGADLSGANLSEANLHMADLSYANLSSAKLFAAIISAAKLSWAILHKAEVGLTVFTDVDLSEVKGLDTVRHSASSSIGIDTFYLSHGHIPEVFLRGAGIPENLIQYLPSIVGKTIRFYSCFISYSTKDQEFAEHLHSDLQAKHVRVWFAPEDIKGGRKLHEQIPEAIRVHDKLLLLLSEHSMSSEWVKTEIYHARQDENRNNKRKLFPIGLVDFGTIRDWEAFDADSGKDMTREIREYFIPDFSNWKDHDAYKKAFDRLLGDLQADD